MIKHLVLFALKDSDNKIEKCQEIKSALLRLLTTVPELISMEVGINENPDELYDISLIAHFNNMDGLKAYANHPDHLAVAQTIRQVLEKRAGIDFSV